MKKLFAVLALLGAFVAAPAIAQNTPATTTTVTETIKVDAKAGTATETVKVEEKTEAAARRRAGAQQGRRRVDAGLHRCWC